MAKTATAPSPRDERLAVLQGRHQEARAFIRELIAMEGRERDPDRLASLRERRKDVEFQAARLECDIADWTS